MEEVEEKCTECNNFRPCNVFKLFWDSAERHLSMNRGQSGDVTNRTTAVGKYWVKFVRHSCRSDRPPLNQVECRENLVRPPLPRGRPSGPAPLHGWSFSGKVGWQKADNRPPPSRARVKRVSLSHAVMR